MGYTQNGWAHGFGIPLLALIVLEEPKNPKRMLLATLGHTSTMKREEPEPFTPAKMQKARIAFAIQAF